MKLKEIKNKLRDLVRKYGGTLGGSYATGFKIVWAGYRVNTTALRMGGKLCFSTMDDKEVVSSVKASDFMAAKCIRNDDNTCLITVEFKDGIPFLEVFGAVDKAVLDSIYS